MAIASGGTLGTGADSTAASASFTFNTATNSLAAGDFGLLILGTDNIATTTGASTTHSTVAGGTGNWSRLHEHTYSPGGVQLDGTTVSIWLFAATGTVNTGTTITVTLSATAARDKACSFWKFTVAAGKRLGLTPTSGNKLTQTVTAGNGYGSSAFSGLASAARLYFRGCSKEGNDSSAPPTTAMTNSTSFTVVTNIRSRNNSAAQRVDGEFRINTSTGETSNPTLAYSGDAASIFLALGELTDYSLDCTAGSYATTGSDAGVLGTRLINAGPGSYAITGADALLDYSPAAGPGTYLKLHSGGHIKLHAGGLLKIHGTGLTAYTLDCAPGSYAITGSDAGLLAYRLINSGAGSYSVTGADAGVLAARLINAAAGAYAVTGADAQILAGRLINAGPGSYDVAGIDAALLAARVLNADAGSISVVGTDSGLEYSAAPAVVTGDSLITQWRRRRGR